MKIKSIFYTILIFSSCSALLFFLYEIPKKSDESEILISSNKSGIIYVNPREDNYKLHIKENNLDKDGNNGKIVISDGENEGDIYKKEILDKEKNPGIFVIGQGNIEVSGSNVNHIWITDKPFFVDEIDYQNILFLNKEDCTKGDHIHKAAARGYYYFVEKCLDLGVDANIKEGLGWTPLFSASRHGHKNIAKLLIKHGGHTNFYDISGRSILDQAIISGNDEIITYIKEKTSKSVDFRAKEENFWKSVEECKEIKCYANYLSKHPKGKYTEIAKNILDKSRVIKKDINHYTDNGDGTIFDKKTNLMWKKCSEGKVEISCIGDAEKYLWADAMLIAKNKSFAGYNNWRIPTSEEIETLVQCKTKKNQNSTYLCEEGSNTEPHINTNVFKNINNVGSIWVSTENPPAPDQMLALSFYSVFLHRQHKLRAAYLHLVRDI